MATIKKIGLLAYGSLITDPGWEIEKVRTDTVTDVLTPFPVEFARSSGKRRGGAPTLVPYQNGGRVRAQVFVVSTSADDAAHRLYRREVHAVGSGWRYEHSENPGPNKVVIERLEGEFGLDIVLYTRIAPTIDNPTAKKLARLAIDSVAEAHEGRDGISYLINAMDAGIETPLTTAYAAEILRRTGANDLAGALSTVRAKVKAYRKLYAENVDILK